MPLEPLERNWSTSAAAGLQLGGDAAIEVLEGDDLLGIGTGSAILIADDTATNRVAYEAALAPLGRELVIVSSGLEALAKLLDQDVALILLDVQMPEMGGLETARMLRARPRNKGTPIIFITGMTWNSDLVREAYELGAFDFVIKPIEPGILRAKVRLYLQLQERTQDVRRQRNELREARLQLEAEKQDNDRTRAAAESTNMRKDEFLAMLGHELRNPLASILSAVEVVKLRGETLGREMSIVDRQASHLARLVHDLLDASRLTHGKISLDRSAVALSDVVQDAIDSARATLELHHHEMVVAVPADLLLDADRDRLCQVLASLLTNAAKYTPDNGRIELVARDAGAFVEIEVRDNGVGIEPPLLPNVFDMFVQGERELVRREGGLGVGLTIVRRVVDLHGGSVAVRSDGPGTGSTFTVRWPKASSQTPTIQLRPLPRPASRKLAILIVDDNEDAAELLAEVARELGHDPIVAYDGRSALHAVTTIRPHVALLDIGLPDMSGYDLAQQLRALPNCLATVLVAVTGYSRAEDRERAMKAGFAHHYAKPVAVLDLSELLESVAVADA